MPASEIDAVRRQAILASLAGSLPPRLSFVCVAAATLSDFVPAADPDPLQPLALQLLFVQVVAFAAIVGAHFIPYDRVYRTRLYCSGGRRCPSRASSSGRCCSPAR